jgi:hypothetical protein
LFVVSRQFLSHIYLPSRQCHQLFDVQARAADYDLFAKKKAWDCKGSTISIFFYMYKKILEDSSNAASISFAVNTDARYFEIVAKVPNFFDGAVFKSERPTNIFKYLRG